MKKLCLAILALTACAVSLSATQNININVVTLSPSSIIFRNVSDRSYVQYINWTLPTIAVNTAYPADNSDPDGNSAGPGSKLISFFLQGGSTAVTQNLLITESLSAGATMLGMNGVQVTLQHLVNGSSAATVLNNITLVAGATATQGNVEIANTPFVLADTTDSTTTFNSSLSTQYVYNYYSLKYSVAGKTPTTAGSLSGTLVTTATVY